MGASLSAEEEATAKLLMQLLIDRGVKNDLFKIKLLLKFLQKQGLPSMASTLFAVKTWDQAEEKIWEAASSGDTNAAEVTATWRMVTETLGSWQAEKEVQNAAAQAITAAEPRSEPARSPERCNLIDLRDNKEEGHGPPSQSPSPLTLSASALPTSDNASLGAQAFDPRE